MNNYDITIIGYGITGMLTLAILQETNYNLNNVCIIDPHFDGGSLIREYGSVISNTPLVKTISALQLINPEYKLPEEYSAYDVNSITPLYVVANIISNFTKPLLEKVTTYETKVSYIDYNNNHTLTCENGSIIVSKVILLCHGGTPKSLSCNIPSIPLHIALNKEILQQYIKPNQKVLVFGTSHSGTLIFKNLHTLNVQAYGIYKNTKPFLFARDGVYDGIKEEAERIADDIINNKYTKLNLYNMNNIDSIIKISKICDWVIYAIGFNTTNIKASFDITKYNPTNGKILETENAYGFGIAYPSLAPDSIHNDVGVISFVEHIQKQLKELKNIIN
jgi:hypothetical protein